MKSSRHPLTPHAAHVLAARLRERGIYAAGRDVLRWPGRSITAAQLWLELDTRLSCARIHGRRSAPTKSAFVAFGHS